ncbi:hypothetical protein [Nonomuraea sp. NPDC005650]|uniref:rhamnogalacturonan lyase family protein n=1 Tax=Nonomuraea sp. NPDC005650 TaxID=3157045 RepID=UPI0033B2EA20
MSTAQQQCSRCVGRSQNPRRQNTAYNQPPHTSFFIGDGMPTPPRPNIYVR